jgi:thiamine biosynthesis lipoprotein
MTHDVHHVEHVMGTVIGIDARAVEVPEVAARAALADVVAWLHHVDATFSTYQLDSDISRFARGALPAGDLTHEVSDVLRECVELTRITGGAFDAYAVAAPNGTRLDPSGYVKGWAVEIAAQMLQDAGVANLCINAGGDIATRGEAGPGHPWRVGVRHPELADRLVRVVELSGGQALATSATYERGAHIIDPRTGEPTTEIASATVIGPELGRVDAFATAVFVMGVDGLAWIETQPGYDAYVITYDGVTCWSSGFPEAPAERRQAS